ncbi:MAG: biopolymer transporter ExbD [Gammaproteobacteria bacterium]|nr:biopolymer transporter ExbD [Gammaproteobacteria bacterium]
MNLRPRRSDLEPEINLIPLIDVLLMMVLFFMFSSTFIVEGRLRVRLPEASSVPVTRPGFEPLVVTVTATGTYFVNDRELINAGADTLRAAVLKVGKAETGQPVTIRADARATHQAVVTAMDVLGRIGYAQMNIVTTDASGAAPP